MFNEHPQVTNARQMGAAWGTGINRALNSFLTGLQQNEQDQRLREADEREKTRFGWAEETHRAQMERVGRENVQHEIAMLESQLADWDKRAQANIEADRWQDNEAFLPAYLAAKNRLMRLKGYTGPDLVGPKFIEGTEQRPLEGGIPSPLNPLDRLPAFEQVKTGRPDWGNAANQEAMERAFGIKPTTFDLSPGEARYAIRNGKVVKIAENDKEYSPYIRGSQFYDATTGTWQTAPMTGYQQGRLGLEQGRLAETSRHNQALEGQGQQRLEQGQQRIDLEAGKFRIKSRQDAIEATTRYANSIKQNYWKFDANGNAVFDHAAYNADVDLFRAKADAVAQAAEAEANLVGGANRILPQNADQLGRNFVHGQLGPGMDLATFSFRFPDLYKRLWDYGAGVNRKVTWTPKEVEEARKALGAKTPAQRQGSNPVSGAFRKTWGLLQQVDQALQNHEKRMNLGGK